MHLLSGNAGPGVLEWDDFTLRWGQANNLRLGGGSNRGILTTSGSQSGSALLEFSLDKVSSGGRIVTMPPRSTPLV